MSDPVQADGGARLGGAGGNRRRVTSDWTVCELRWTCWTGYQPDWDKLQHDFPAEAPRQGTHAHRPFLGRPGGGRRCPGVGDREQGALVLRILTQLERPPADGTIHETVATFAERVHVKETSGLSHRREGEDPGGRRPTGALVEPTVSDRGPAGFWTRDVQTAGRRPGTWATWVTPVAPPCSLQLRFRTR